MEVSPHELNASYTTAGEFRVHRAGCRDIARQRNNWDANYGDVRTPEGIAQDLWDDIINEGSMTAEEAVDHVTFLPCCEFKNNLEEVVDANANNRYTEVVGQEEDQPEGVTMNEETRNEQIADYANLLKVTKATELRKMAAAAGIKTVGNGHKVGAGRKADLIFALVENFAANLAVEEEAKPAKKAPKNSRKATADENANGTLAIRTARRFVEEATAKGWKVEIDNQMATEAGDVVVITAAKGDESITLRWIDGAYDYYQGGSFHTDAKGKARKILNTSAAINRYL